MENVKGILSSKLNGKFVFHQILKDLADPQAAVGEMVINTGFALLAITLVFQAMTTLKSLMFTNLLSKLKILEFLKPDTESF